MECLIESGIYELPCLTIGGIKSVWIGTYSELNKFGLNTANTITSVVSGNPVLYKFAQDVEKAGLISTGEFGENLSARNLTTLAIKLYDIDEELRNQYLLLQKAPLMAIVESTTGKFVMVGVDSPGRTTASTLGFGTLELDLNGADLTITWKNQNAFYMVDENLFNTVGGITLINSVIS